MVFTMVKVWFPFGYNCRDVELHFLILGKGELPKTPILLPKLCVKHF